MILCQHFSRLVGRGVTEEDKPERGVVFLVVHFVPKFRRSSPNQQKTGE